MQENFIRKLDQQIEKTEEDKNVQEKCREDQKEQEETFDMSTVGNHGATKKQLKNKVGRGATATSYYAPDATYGSLASYGIDKVGKAGGANAFDFP
jgi:TolA-binding protein